MNIEEKLKNIYNEGIVICVHSLEEDLELRNLLHLYGYKWCNYRNYLDVTEANTSKEYIEKEGETNYLIRDGKRSQSYKNEKYKKVNFEDLFQIIDIKEKLSKAKIVDNKYLVLPEGKYIFKDNILYAIN